MNLASRIKILFQKYDVLGFLTIGGITSLLNIATFALSIEIGLSSYLAVAMGNFISTLIYFLGLSKLFSSPGSMSSIVRFLFLVVAYYFISIALLEALNIIIDHILWSRALALAIAAPINYFAQKYFVFRD